MNIKIYLLLVICAVISMFGLSASFCLPDNQNTTTVSHPVTPFTDLLFENMAIDSLNNSLIIANPNLVSNDILKPTNNISSRSKRESFQIKLKYAIYDIKYVKIVLKMFDSNDSSKNIENFSLSLVISVHEVRGLEDNLVFKECKKLVDLFLKGAEVSELWIPYYEILMHPSMN